jgi:hypothetical protein
MYFVMAYTTSVIEIHGLYERMALSLQFHIHFTERRQFLGNEFLRPLRVNRLEHIPNRYE